MKFSWLKTFCALSALALCMKMVVVPGLAEAGEITLSEDGRARADIVIPEHPSSYVQFAAEELKRHLDRITGGDFPIVHRPTAAVRIRLGPSAEAAAAGLDPETLERDGFFIHARGNVICIVGRDNPVTGAVNYFHLFYDEDRRGTLLRTCEFLEQVGVRWPAPGPENAFIPHRPTLRIPEGTRKIEPFFADRKLGRFFAFMRRNPDAHEYADDVAEIYTRDEMRKIAAMVTDIEATAAGDPLYRKRAGLLRTWIFDVMEKERQAAIGAFAHLLPGRAIVQSFPLPSEKWRFKRDPTDLGRARGWYHADHPDEDWESIGIGKAWGHFGHEGYIGAGWYRRTFDLPEQGDARDALLLFEGVDETAHVWINGRHAGEHDRGPDGWNQPFSVEITEHVSWGAPNQITVRVRNTRGAGGIWRPLTVYLLKSTHALSIHTPRH